MSTSALHRRLIDRVHDSEAAQAELRGVVVEQIVDAEIEPQVTEIARKNVNNKPIRNL